MAVGRFQIVMRVISHIPDLYIGIAEAKMSAMAVHGIGVLPAFQKLCCTDEGLPMHSVRLRDP